MRTTAITDGERNDDFIGAGRVGDPDLHRVEIRKPPGVILRMERHVDSGSGRTSFYT